MYSRLESAIIRLYCSMPSKMPTPSKGAVLGLLAAALFGVSPPVTKLLLPEAGPLFIAGLLYLGAGLGLLAVGLMSWCRSKSYKAEASIQRADFPLLAGIVLTGGILGPVFMLFGLQRLSGVLGSLLLNLEAPFTILIAIALFREHLGRRELFGALLIIIGAALFSYHFEEIHGDVMGVFAMAAACLSWAIDNNLSQRLSSRDPLAVTRFKTLLAGTCTLTLALVTGQRLPSPSIILGALLLGLVSYGISVMLDLRALRLLGAAREAGYFATAPFIGAVAAIPLLGEAWGRGEMVSAGLMGVGLIILLREHHNHSHSHPAMEHDHAHVHDTHHAHAHDEEEATLEPHAHAHRHLPLVHDHPHVSEVHHRHAHR